MWNSLFFCMTRGTACFLHDMWNSLFFCMTRGTACFLHDTWNSFTFFRTVLHVMCMWFNPKVPPCFFPVRLPYVGSSWNAPPPAWHQSLQPAKPAPHRGRDSSTEVGIPTSVFCRKTHHRASAEGLGAMLSSQHRSQSVFFTIHTPSRQSWRGRRIAHSILAWQQDCPKNPSPQYR